LRTIFTQGEEALKVTLANIAVRCAAGAALLIFAPVFVVAFVAIAIEDGRPFLFRQIRVGLNGKAFELLKLRSMFKSSAGVLITKRGDERVTRVGGFLRRYKMDELPQLWNVLCGEMGLIGPRPEVPSYVDASDPAWQKVLRLKPGITDLATLAFREEEEILAQSNNISATYRKYILPAKLALTMEYERSRSLSSDLKLVALTVRYSLIPRGFDARTVVDRVMGKPMSCTSVVWPGENPDA
jgi:lipopolysaccharide/colanic/teichoic acid biosynthesis glycosyltransferase